MLQIVASLIDAARGVIYDRHMFIVQATGLSFQHLKVLRVYVMQLWYCETILPNLKLKTRPKQLLGSLPLDIALPDIGH
jgi:hypothetical protein